jgi:predicted amino acid racemase
MTSPRLEIDLNKIEHNACSLVERLRARGISVTAVTKAVLGAPEVTAALIRAGVVALGDPRMTNVRTMRGAGIKAPIMLIRSPMPSEVEQVVLAADFSVNTELDVVRRLSDAARAARRIHGVLLMVELGDLREGIMPGELVSFVRAVLSLPNIALKGIGTNLACLSGVVPNAGNMAELSALADSIEAVFGDRLRPRPTAVTGMVMETGLEIVSGGNSANLQWALSGADTGRINNLRLGEAILLGCEPLHRQPIDGLHTDAFTLVAEVIETKLKPVKPRGQIAETAFGEVPRTVTNQTSDSAVGLGFSRRTVLALGRQDADVDGLLPPVGMSILGASSDHTIIDTRHIHHPVGSEIRFQLNYSALLRAMTSPFVAKEMKTSMQGAGARAS